MKIRQRYQFVHYSLLSTLDLATKMSTNSDISQQSTPTIEAIPLHPLMPEHSLDDFLMHIQTFPRDLDTTEDQFPTNFMALYPGELKCLPFTVFFLQAYRVELQRWYHPMKSPQGFTKSESRGRKSSRTNAGRYSIYFSSGLVVLFLGEFHSKDKKEGQETEVN